MIFMGPFPLGNVSTIRINSYCKALVKSGVYVKVYIISPTKEAAINSEKIGNIDGIDFEYIIDITWKKQSPSLIYKLYFYLKGIVSSIMILKKDRINCLLSYHDEIISNLLYRTFCSLQSIPFVIDKTEYPKKMQGASGYKKFVQFRLKLFDGVITITNELKQFYQKFLHLSNEKIFLLPMTVDVDRYRNIKPNSDGQYIAVMFGVHNRDGLIDSIKSYVKYVNTIQENPFKLMLIGDFNELCRRFPLNLEILDIIKHYNIDKLVTFEGLVDSKYVPSILVGAQCLLTTPKKYDSGGFPTKLGEYLLSGVPVVATAAGEIPKYLTNGKNILMSDPYGDIELIAQNLVFVHRNPNEAKKIASNGKKLAEEVFNADTYVASIIAFLEKLRK